LSVKIEHLVVISIPRVDPPGLDQIDLTREQARELYDALHAEFGPVVKESFTTLVGGLPDPVALCAAMSVPQGCAETGPTLNDDIEAMKADQSPDAGKMVDDADEQEAEFLSRLPHDGTSRDQHYNSPCKLLPVEPSNTPEPPAEPEPAPETPSLSNDRQVRNAWAELTASYPERTVGQQVNQLSARFNMSASRVRDILGDLIPPKETDQARAVRLWGQYREKYPQEWPNATVSRVKSHMKRLTANEVRALLRSGGIDVPEPMSIEETAANARRAQQQLRDSEPKAPLLDRFPEPPANLDVLDALALTFELLEEQHPQISSFITTRVGLAATMAYKAAVEAFKPEYEAMAPFARRDFKSAIAARWHKERGA